MSEGGGGGEATAGGGGSTPGRPGDATEVENDDILEVYSGSPGADNDDVEFPEGDDVTFDGVDDNNPGDNDDIAPSDGDVEGVPSMAPQTVMVLFLAMNQAMVKKLIVLMMVSA